VSASEVTGVRGAALPEVLSAPEPDAPNETGRGLVRPASPATFVGVFAVERDAMNSRGGGGHRGASSHVLLFLFVSARLAAAQTPLGRA
jgi:hypothetical protein